MKYVKTILAGALLVLGARALAALDGRNPQDDGNIAGAEFAQKGVLSGPERLQTGFITVF